MSRICDSLITGIAFRALAHALALAPTKSLILDEDPRILELFEKELAQRGLPSKMREFTKARTAA